MDKGQLIGVLALSTYLPLAQHFSPDKHYQERVPSILMAHGLNDSVVPIGYGESSMQTLRDLGIPVKWEKYPMEHNLCDEEIMLIRNWLIERLD